MTKENEDKEESLQRIEEGKKKRKKELYDELDKISSLSSGNLSSECDNSRKQIYVRVPVVHKNHNLIVYRANLVANLVSKFDKISEYSIFLIL